MDLLALHNIAIASLHFQECKTKYKTKKLKFKGIPDIKRCKMFYFIILLNVHKFNCLQLLNMIVHNHDNINICTHTMYS